MRAYGYAHHVGGLESVPLPTGNQPIAPRLPDVVCACGHEGRPGAFHVHLEPTPPEPVIAPEPKPAPKPRAPRRPRTQSLKSSTPRKSQRTKQCKCGTLIYPQSIECMPCSVARRSKRRAA